MFPVNFLTPWTAPVNVVQHLHLDSVLQNRRNLWVSIPTLTQSNDVQCIDKRIPHFDPSCIWHSQDHELVNSSNLKITIRICGWVWIFDQYSQWHALSTLHLSCFEIPFPFFLAVPVSVPYKKSVAIFHGSGQTKILPLQKRCRSLNLCIFESVCWVVSS